MSTKKKRLTLSFCDRSLHNIEYLKDYWNTKQISNAIERTLDYVIVNGLLPNNKNED